VLDKVVARSRENVLQHANKVSESCQSEPLSFGSDYDWL
jgi:hypothetical protein